MAEVVRLTSWPCSRSSSRVAAGVADGVDGLDEHAAGAAGGVDDGLTGLRVEDLHEQVDDVAGGEELAGLLAGRLGELPQQVLIRCAEHVALDVVGVERTAVEGVQQGDQGATRAAGPCCPS